MPSAVSGLTKQEAPSAAVVPSGSGSTSLALMTRYCAYIAPPIIATVLPINALAASDDPVLITTPAPSLPTGMDSSSRAAIAFSAASGTFAVNTGWSLVPETLAVEMSAGPIRSPRSDGLIGEASTRTTTSSSAGSGVGTLASEISSSPLFLSSERSCSPVLPSLILTSSLSAVRHAVADPRFASSMTISDMVAVGNGVQLYRRFQSSPRLPAIHPGRYQPGSSGALHVGNG